MPLDEDNFIPVKEYAESNNISSSIVIEEIRSGKHIGQLIDNEWHIYVLDETNDDTSIRLGNVKHLKGIDPEYLPLFAKISRIIGLVIIISFVIWGLSYSWSYRSTPFEALMRGFGVKYRNSEAGAFVFSGVVLFIGWYYRFGIGTIFTSIIFKFYDAIKLLFNKI